MASPYADNIDVAHKQRWALLRVFLDREWLKAQRQFQGGELSRVVNPARWTVALAEKWRKTPVVMALLTNIRDPGDLDQWTFERFLGAGSFGAAALYRKEDSQRFVVDALAIKASPAVEQQKDLSDNGAYPYISMEAAVMSQLNLLSESAENDDFLYLRKYTKPSSMPRGFSELHDAYYLEYAFHGSLSNLCMQYRAWNRHFPEYFLWHLFRSFARLAVMMENGPFKWLGPDTKINGRKVAFGDELPGAFLHHADIKPDNILLTSPEANMYRHEHDAELPAIRLADFGCSRVVHPDHFQSKKRYHVRGNMRYHPPELRTNLLKQPELWGSKHEWAAKFLGQGLLGQKHFSAGASVWSFGAIMWEMMTLRDPDELSNLVNKRMQVPIATTLRGNPLPEDFMKPAGENAPKYTRNLKNLIRKCLNMKPEARESPESLLCFTQDHWRHHYAQHRHQPSSDDFEVQPSYEGEANFELNDLFWSVYTHDVVALADPELPLPIPDSKTTIKEVEYWITELHPALNSAWEDRKTLPGARDERIITEGLKYRQWYNGKFERDVGREEVRQRRRSSRLSLGRYSQAGDGPIHVGNESSTIVNRQRHVSASKRKMNDREVSPGPSAQERRPTSPSSAHPNQEAPVYVSSVSKHRPSPVAPEEEAPVYVSHANRYRPSPAIPEEEDPLYVSQAGRYRPSPISLEEAQLDRASRHRPASVSVDSENKVEINYGLPIDDWGARARDEIGLFEPSPDGPDPEGVEYNPTRPDNAGTPIEPVREAAHNEVRPGRAMGQGARQRRRRRQAQDPEPWLIDFDESNGDTSN